MAVMIAVFVFLWNSLYHTVYSQLNGMIVAYLTKIDNRDSFHEIQTSSNKKVKGTIILLRYLGIEEHVNKTFVEETTESPPYISKGELFRNARVVKFDYYRNLSYPYKKYEVNMNLCDKTQNRMLSTLSHIQEWNFLKVNSSRYFTGFDCEYRHKPSWGKYMSDNAYCMVIVVH